MAEEEGLQQRLWPPEMRHPELVKKALNIILQKTGLGSLITYSFIGISGEVKNEKRNKNVSDRNLQHHFGPGVIENIRSLGGYAELENWEYVCGFKVKNWCDIYRDVHEGYGIWGHLIQWHRDDKKYSNEDMNQQQHWPN